MLVVQNTVVLAPEPSTGPLEHVNMIHTHCGTGPRVVDAVLVNQSDCAVKMLWWRGHYIASCARKVTNHGKHR